MTTKNTQVVTVIAVLLGVVTIGVGGALAFGVVDIGGSDTDQIDRVPDDVSGVMYYNSALEDDEATTDIFNSYLEAISFSDDDPQTISELEEEFTGETELDSDGFNSAIMFYDHEETASSETLQNEEYGGLIFDTEWEEDEFVTEIEDESEFTTLTEDEYNGHTIYTFEEDNTAIGVLDDGIYVMGSEDAVQDAIDVEVGDASSLSGDVRDAYENEQDGYIKFAAEVPSETVPDSQSQQPVDYNVYEKVNIVSGAYYTDGSEIATSISMSTDTDAEAQDVYDVTNGAVSMVRGSSNNEELDTLISNVEIEQTDNTVTIEYRSDSQEIVDMIESLGGQNQNQF